MNHERFSSCGLVNNLGYSVVRVFKTTELFCTYEKKPHGFARQGPKLAIIISLCIAQGTRKNHVVYQLLPLVGWCNGTTAGLGHWEVGLNWPYNTPPALPLRFGSARASVY